MAIISLAFNFENINTSVQIGDTAYYAATSTVGQHDTAAYPDIIQIGEITDIIPWNGSISQILCLWNPNPPLSPIPGIDSFILFSKDNKANLSSALGYYAEVQFVNESPNESELFAVNADVFESSK